MTYHIALYRIVAKDLKGARKAYFQMAK